LFVVGAHVRRRIRDLLDAQAGDRPSDHQLLDLAGALEDRVVQTPGVCTVRVVLLNVSEQGCFGSK
jgi:hypothetical protein